MGCSLVVRAERGATRKKVVTPLFYLALLDRLWQNTHQRSTTGDTDAEWFEA